MANTIATDSAEELKEIIGDDSTATFENDPNFVESNPTGGASSENVEQQRDTDDVEDSEEEEGDAEDPEDDDEDLEDEEDEEDVIGKEDDEDDEDEDEEDLEDDEDEVAAAPGLRADGLLGQEDELEDAAKDRDRVQGDAARDEDEDEGDVEPGVDEDALDEDDLDTDKVASTDIRNAGAVIGAATSTLDVAARI